MLCWFEARSRLVLHPVSYHACQMFPRSMSRLGKKYLSQLLIPSSWYLWHITCLLRATWHIEQLSGLLHLHQCSTWQKYEVHYVGLICFQTLRYMLIGPVSHPAPLHISIAYCGIHGCLLHNCHFKWEIAFILFLFRLDRFSQIRTPWGFVQITPFRPSGPP